MTKHFGFFIGAAAMEMGVTLTLKHRAVVTAASEKLDIGQC